MVGQARYISVRENPRQSVSQTFGNPPETAVAVAAVLTENILVVYGRINSNLKKKQRGGILAPIQNVYCHDLQNA